MKRERNGGMIQKDPFKKGSKDFVYMVFSAKFFSKEIMQYRAIKLRVFFPNMF